MDGEKENKSAEFDKKVNEWADWIRATIKNEREIAVNEMFSLIRKAPNGDAIIHILEENKRLHNLTLTQEQDISDKNLKIKSLADENARLRGENANLREDERRRMPFVQRFSTEMPF